MRSLTAGVLVTLTVIPAFAADPPTLDEQITKVKLTDAEAKALKQFGFVVGEAEYRQVFSPYLGGDLPRFITADSLLNAFHVVFEESVFRLEQANARKLPLILADIARHLPDAEKALAGDAELTRKAGRRARVFLGTAVALLDPKSLPADADDRKLVEGEVKRVEAATGTEKPDWLGPPDKGFKALDYSRFKPRGFYTRTPKTEAYFRAISWLQAIPWRVDKDEEFAAILLLAHAYQAAQERKDWIGKGFWATFEKFLGTGDDWQLPDASYSVPKTLTADNLAESRKKVMKDVAKKGGPEINDQLRFQPDTPDGKVEPHFRFVSAYRLPDAVLLQRTATRDRMPGGLEVAVALGSPFARKKLEKGAAEVMKKVEKNAALFAKPERGETQNLYAAYLDCLRELLEQTEPDAPKVFHSEAWGAKTCQTALGGWAQMRHTWVLQAKQSEHYLSAFLTRDAGFVEPVPEFYAKFAALVERSQKLFEKAGAFDPPPNPAIPFDNAFAARKAIQTARAKGLAALTEDERKALVKLIPDLPLTGDPKDDSALDQTLSRANAKADAAMDADETLRIWKGGYAPTEPQECWPQLSNLCYKLETLAHKQLRGATFREDEKEFILGYGKTLAAIMFYGGNSYIDPKDDAPRVVDVHRQQGKSLEVGLGRPRVLWVVYPWKGNDVLCRGAVLPYHEFASAERLTDKQWRELLDSPKAPPQPEWVNGWTVPKKK